MNANDLKSDRLELSQKIDALLNRAMNANRGLTAGEKKEYDEMDAEIDNLTDKIHRLEKSEGRTERLSRVHSPISLSINNGQEAPPSTNQDRDVTKNCKHLFGQIKREYRGSEFSSLLEMSQVILSGRHDPRLFEFSGGVEAVGSEGGFLVAPEHSEKVLDSMINQSFQSKACSSYGFLFG